MYHAGQKFVPSASRENEIDRLLRDARAGRLAYERDPLTDMPLGHMLAKNVSGADYAYGSVVMYHGTDGYRTTQGQAAFRRDWDMRKDYLEIRDATDLLSNEAAPFSGMAITLESIANNALGLVAIGGIALVNMAPTTTGNFVYLQPHPTNQAVYSYWGFGRALAWRTGVAVVDLSDRQFEVAYTLTANMSGASANATLGINGGRTWTTTVHDLHGIAGFQKSGDKGFAEWRGYQWIIKVAYC
jgi:hypothetical protein